MSVILHGYAPSVYSWIARLALCCKGVAWQWREVDPFAADIPADYLALHPFKRVPVLQVGEFVLYETAAIARYVDEAFPGPSLQPERAEDRARVAQLIGILDSYGYWPLVRQVFAHAVFGPRIGRPSDPEQIQQGLQAAPRILDEIARLAGDGTWLAGHSASLADIHAAPMLAYFTMDASGMALLRERSRLAQWWAAIEAWPPFRETKPRLPEG